MATVETVLGPVDAADLGLTLVHEHLRFSSEGVRTQWPHLYDEDRERADAVAGVKAAMEQGVRTLVDPSCLDLGRDARLAIHVAEETGAHIVMCTGVYGARYTFLPQTFAFHDPSYMVDAFVHDIEVGIQGTDAKAGFLKCAVDEPGITEDVEKILRAIAQASLRTGAPIMAHTHPGTKRGLEIMDVFDEEGVDPRKVQLAHTGDTDDLDHIEALLDRGAWIGMDRYGLDIILPNDRRNATVIELCRRGHADRMMLSQDAPPAAGNQDWYPAELKPQLAPEWDFTFLWRGVLPALREGGVSDEQIETMLVANPAAWLTA